MVNLNFTVHKFNVLNSKNDEQVLSYFNGETDFLDILDSYFTNLLTHIKKSPDSQGNLKILSLKEPCNINDKDRIISGYFDLGVSGKDFNVKDNDTNEVNYSVNKNQNLSRNLFFMACIPKGKNFGIILLEKKEQYGLIKEFSETLNTYFNSLGYSEYRLKINQMPIDIFIQDFLKNGKLKEINCIKNSIPNDIRNQESELRLPDGKQIISYKVPESNNTYKDFIISLYNINYLDYEKVHIQADSFDEISFLIRYKNQEKNFYVKDKDKIKSNMKLEVDNQEYSSIDEMYFIEFKEIIKKFIFPNSK